MGYLEGLKNWFKNKPIRRKITAIYIPMVLLPLFILGYVATSIFSKAIIDKTSKSVSDNSVLIIQKLESMISNTESCANVLVFFLNRIQPQEFESRKDELHDLDLYRKIINQLDIGRTMFSDVESVTFIDLNGRIYSTRPLIEKQTKVIGSDFLKELDNAPTGVSKWFPMQQRDFLASDPTKPVLSMGKKVISIDTNKEIGYIILNLQENQLSSVFKNVGPTSGGSYFISDNNGMIISSRNSEDLFKPVGTGQFRNLVQQDKDIQEILSLGSKEQLITIRSIPKFGWRLVSHIPLKELTEDTRKTTTYIIVIGLICFVFTIIGATFLSRFISRPIALLSTHMLSHSDGKVGTYYQSGTTMDEVGLLASSFNTMIGRINELMSNIRYEQKKKREYELALLQSQIKPHFLYNTLELIYALIDFGTSSELKKATKALASFYRSTLSKGKEIIDIMEEISIVQNYLYIQRIRYSDIFDFAINVSEDIFPYRIPKLTLQPLVENAIYHGLKLKGSFGRINIEGFKNENIIILRVNDDGIGIPHDRINEILNHKPDERPKESFGLSSVDERIKLFYGQEYGIIIKSEVDAGTEIEIRIPIQMLGDDEHA